MVDLLIGGPPLALQFLESLGRRQSHDTWTDPLWCDGGAVFDFDRRRVVFFGDSLMVEMPFRRTILAALAEVWAGYEICYAYDGTAEIGGYVGKEFALPSLDGLSAPKLAKSRNSLCHLVSVIDASGELRMWPLWWGDSKAWHGPALLDKLPGSGVRRLRLDKIPEGGVHIDVPRNVSGCGTPPTSWVCSGHCRSCGAAGGPNVGTIAMRSISPHAETRCSCLPWTRQISTRP